MPLASKDKAVPMSGTADPADQDAFLRLMYRRVVGVLRLRGHGVDDAEEIAQEALARAVEHWQQVTAASSPEAWVLRVALNVANSRLRRLRTRRQKEPLVRTSQVAHDEDVSERLAVADAVRQLPVRQREAIVLRHFADLSVAESAEVMGCAAGTVRALTAQAIAALRQSFQIDLPEEQE